eukprot:7289988-Prymnesium_polylepis.1
MQGGALEVMRDREKRNEERMAALEARLVAAEAAASAASLASGAPSASTLELIEKVKAMESANRLQAVLP